MAELHERHWGGNPTAATRAERTPCRYYAYVPDRLTGQTFALSASLLADVTDVERSLLELNRDRHRVITLEALARLLLRAEAVASSFIEGLRVNVRRLAKEEVAERDQLGNHDATARAVLGNIRAMESALQLADPSRQVTVADLRALHHDLLVGTHDERWGGVVRTEQNWIGGTGLSPCTAKFVPPPPAYVSDLLEDLCAYLSGDEHPALVQAALVHAQFETIHPFLDGNGRVGRALIHAVLRRRGLAPYFVPPLSLVLATHADLYVRGLTRYRYVGPQNSAEASASIADWLTRFVVDAGQACADASQLAEQLSDLERTWRSRVGNPRKDSSVDLLLRALPAAPVLTARTASELIGRSVQRTNDAIARLVEGGVLKQITVGRRNRAFEAPELTRAITGFERALASPAGDTRQAAPARPAPDRHP